MKISLLSTALLAVVMSNPAVAAADFWQFPGSLSKTGYVSGDGRAFVWLESGGGVLSRWTEQAGTETLYKVSDRYVDSRMLKAVSSDGSLLLFDLPQSISGKNPGTTPALWSQAGGFKILDIPAYSALGWGMSADGRVVVGTMYSTNSTYVGQAFRWSEAQGLQVFQGDSIGESFFAGAVSGDGRVVAVTVLRPRSEVVLWTQGASNVSFAPAPGYSNVIAYGVSHDGSRVVGRLDQHEPYLRSFPYVWDSKTGIMPLGLLSGYTGGEAKAISGDGKVVVGSMYAFVNSPRPSGIDTAFRWSAQTGTLSIAQWLAAYGVEVPAGAELITANSTSFDGSIIAGEGRYGSLWLARVKGPSGGFLLDVDAYQRSLIDANQRLTLGLSGLANATLSGAHHRSLLDNGLASESDGSCAWVNAEAADYDESKTRIEQLEVGVCTDLGPARLGLGLGKAKARQEWDLGSQSKSEGEYLLGEAAFKLGEQWQGSLLGYSGRFDVDSQRRYYNGTAVHTSSARPDAKVAALRARLDWKDAARVGGVGISPYAAYTWTRTKLDGYAESGGGFPSRFDRTDWSTRDLRVGAAFERSFGERSDLSVSLEAVRRMDKISSGTRGEIIDLFSFDLPGGELDRNWGQMLVDFDHRFGNGSVLGVGARAASSGGDADWGVSLGYRMSF
ncbi:autotransporter domain-containing protein [Lysobacter sp. 22409]|uniref:autotransporter domain-containing protein n=1 Tax=Lysobacter sp. 22409 TaxID=3453917 RepID=UPI003F837C0F